jgi:hypothetical protein
MLGAGDRHDVIALREKPCQRHLRRRRTGLIRDTFHGIHDAQVLLEVAFGEFMSVRFYLEPVDAGDVAVDEAVRMAVGR